MAMGEGGGGRHGPEEVGHVSIHTCRFLMGIRLGSGNIRVDSLVKSGAILYPHWPFQWVSGWAWI